MWADGHRVHQSPDGTLLIHNLQARDAGSYTCSAYRGNQAVSRSTEVKVVPPGKKGLCLPLRAGCVLQSTEVQALHLGNSHPYRASLRHLLVV